MCHGYHQRYQQCGHLRLPIHYVKCEVANRSGVRCQELVISGELQTIPKPRLCEDCYRKREDEIFASFEKERQVTKDDIKHTQQALQMNRNMDEDTRAALKRQARTMRAALSEYAMACDEKLARLRQEQGVWGEGLPWFSRERDVHGGTLPMSF